MLNGFFRNIKVRVGFAVFAIFGIVALLGPWFVENVMHTSGRKIYYDNLGQSPSSEHPFGTTLQGADVLTQVILGAQGSVFIGFLSGVIATALAALIGVPAGFLGGKLDSFLNAFTNLFLTLPSFALTLIIAGYLQGTSWWVIAILIAAFEWPGGARYLRAQTLSMRGRDFTVAMRMIGESKSRLVFVEVLPHMTGIISAMFLRAMIAGVFAEAALSFLGIGTTGTISWGTIISEAQQQSAILNGLWWWFIPPGLCIALLGTATALINFGIDEISNPRLSAVNRKLMKQFARVQRRQRAEAPVGPSGEPIGEGAR